MSDNIFSTLESIITRNIAKNKFKVVCASNRNIDRLSNKDKSKDKDENTNTILAKKTENTRNIRNVRRLSDRNKISNTLLAKKRNIINLLAKKQASAITEEMIKNSNAAKRIFSDATKTPPLTNYNDIREGGIYTADELKNVLGVLSQNGISVPADKPYIILKSNYSMSHRFDDRYDEASGIYIYNGSGNKTELSYKCYRDILSASENGKAILLFVATKDANRKNITTEDFNDLRYFTNRAQYIYCGELVLIEKTNIKRNLNNELPEFEFKPQDRESFTEHYGKVVYYTNNRPNKEAEILEEKTRRKMSKKTLTEEEKKLAEKNKQYEEDVKAFNKAENKFGKRVTRKGW